MIGSQFARVHMESKGWEAGDGLGKHKQGITDAIKPKLKFDQTGIGHNKADEFEFHWWDHVFNKAAKSVKVDTSEGDVKVEFDIDKAELTTKKLRKKAHKSMQKQMKQQLYSNFVKAGTLSGGLFEKEGNDSEYVEEKDMSKIKTLSDDDLVKACGGRTAHKGGRHGIKMNAKLARIEQAEKEFLEKFAAKSAPLEIKPKKRKRSKESVEDEGGGSEKENEIKLPAVDSSIAEVPEVVKKKKKKKKERDLQIEADNVSITDFGVEPTVLSKVKKKKRHKDKDSCIVAEESSCDIVKKKKKKSKKSKGCD